MAATTRIRGRRATPALAGALALLAGCSGAAKEQPAVTPLAVEAATVAPAGAASIGADSYPVTLHRDREARLAFRAGGIIAAIPVRPGDRLGQGALVAAVDAAAQAAAVRRAAAEVERLERAAGRYDRLAQAGAVGTAQALDSGSALAQARAALDAARHDLADTRIRMPFPGTVLQRHAEIGEVVGAGTPVATVVDSAAPLLAVADVPVEQAARLRAGARGWLHLPGQAGPVPATVARTPGGADPASGTVRIELRIARPAGLVSGQTGSLTFAGQGEPSGGEASVIPAEALLWVRHGTAGVYIIDGQLRARGRVVQFQGMSGDAVRIAGLPQGMRVITTGAGFAHEGQRVEVAGR